MWGIAETLAWMVSKECLDDQRVEWWWVCLARVIVAYFSINNTHTYSSHCHIFTLSSSLCKPHAIHPFPALKNQRNSMNLFLISWTSPRGQPLAHNLSSLQSTPPCDVLLVSYYKYRPPHTLAQVAFFPCHKIRHHSRNPCPSSEVDTTPLNLIYLFI
jgi:hypothetical protein